MAIFYKNIYSLNYSSSEKQGQVSLGLNRGLIPCKIYVNKGDAIKEQPAEQVLQNNKNMCLN